MYLFALLRYPCHVSMKPIEVHMSCIYSLYWGTHVMYLWSLLSYTCPVSIRSTEVHMSCIYEAYWATHVMYLFALLRYTCHVSMKPIELHMSCIYSLYWGTHVMYLWSLLSYTCPVSIRSTEVHMLCIYEAYWATHVLYLFSLLRYHVTYRFSVLGYSCDVSTVYSLLYLFSAVRYAHHISSTSQHNTESVQSHIKWVLWKSWSERMTRHVCANPADEYSTFILNVGQNTGHWWQETVAIFLATTTQHHITHQLTDEHTYTQMSQLC